MNYTAVIFNNTGFNNSNIPDSDTFIYNNLTPVLTTTPLNILQNIGLSSITVKSEYENIKNVDYCYIYKTDQRDREHTVFYFITSVNMVNSNTVVLTLSPDYLTTAGGPKELKFLDGITERHHVALENFGTYTEEDPLLKCTEPLELVVCKPFETTPESQTNLYTMVDSTIDLIEFGDPNNPKKAKTYTDPTSGETVTVPHTVNFSKHSNVKYIIIDNRTGTPTTITNTKQGILPFALNDPTTSADTHDIYDALNLARDIGVEQSIISQYEIPSMYGNYSIEITKVLGENNIYEIEWTSNIVETPIPYTEENPINGFIYDKTVKNKRVLYGENNQYTLMTSSGNKATYKPENITPITYGPITPEEDAPIVISYADCSSEGAPYFRFKTVNNNQNPFINTLKGAPWRQVPLIYTQKSGNVLDTQVYQNETQLNATRLTNAYTQLTWNNLKSLANQSITAPVEAANIGLSASNASKSVDAYKAAFSGGASLTQSVLGFYTIPKDHQIAANALVSEYKNTELIRLYNYYSNIMTVAPEINFPYNNDFIRDFFGNSYMVYRFKPSTVDLNRQDKLLTMYGYKHTTTLEPSFFTNRKNFNFVAATNITIANKIPNWMKTGIASQLEGGVRIWHVLPDEKYYYDNPPIA